MVETVVVPRHDDGQIGDEEPISDDELTALALAADPDAEVDADAVPITEVVDFAAADLLPGWYMPAAMGVRAPLQGWRRRMIWLIITSFILINMYGLCSTYGHVGFG